MTPLRASHRTASIALNETTSNAIPLEGRMVVGLRIPGTIEGTAITFTGSEAFDGTYAAIYDSDGAQVSAAIAASRWIGLSGAEADAVSSAPYIKLVSNAAGGENTAVDIEVVFK